MLSFVFDTLTSDGRPVAVCVMCRSRDREIKETLKKLKNIEFGSYSSGYTVDYRLSSMLRELLEPFGGDIEVFGATVKAGKADCPTGGIIGRIGEGSESAAEGLFSSGGMTFYTAPGRLAFAIDGGIPGELTEKALEEGSAETIYSALTACGRDFVFIADGSGGGKGAAAVRGEIVLLSETEAKSGERTEFFGLKRIGIMGGTFDPVHYGHLIAAETVRDELSLDKVIFMPTGHTTYKKGRPSEGRHRYTMTALAAADNPAFLVSSMELAGKGYSYTADTVRKIRERCGRDTEIFFITGSDVVEYMSGWKDFSALTKMCSFAAVNRGGSHGGAALDRLSAAGADIKRIDIPDLEISSSMIRERIRNGKTVKYLLPESVEGYIRLHGLYTGGKAESDLDTVLDKLI